MHRQARANLGRGAGMSGYGELGDIADGDGGSGIDPRIDALVVDGAADLVEYGHDTLLKCIGRGESDSLERVGGHIDARSPSARAASAASSEVTVAQICGSSR